MILYDLDQEQGIAEYDDKTKRWTLQRMYAAGKELFAEEAAGAA